MITFYPGPSKLYPAVRDWLVEGYDTGILSQNHRSSAFEQLLAQTIVDLKAKLRIPADYSVFFTSSATETWEIMAQELALLGSYHVWNGSFGQKWAEQTQKITQKTENQQFDKNELPTIPHLAPHLLLCLTHNETANGTQLPYSVWEQISRQQPDNLVAADVTSSLGGTQLFWGKADIWFASVQKCLGLPSGLAVLVVSRRVVDRVRQNQVKKYYNSLLSLIENAERNQTTHTPNILGIYLVGKMAQTIPFIEQTSLRIRQQAQQWYHFFENRADWQPLIQNVAARSDTVIVVEGKPEQIRRIKQEAHSQGFVLGNGYGEWKNNTFRIANFPAISTEEIEALQDFFRRAEDTRSLAKLSMN